MQRLRDAGGERGESLVELVIAILILGICVVAIGSGIAMSITISGVHARQTTAAAFLHNYAETLQTAYTKCASAGGTPPNYVAIASLPTPATGNFNAPTATVAFWNPATKSYGATCPAPASDSGLQQVTLTLSTQNGRVSESLVVTLRNNA